MAFPFWNKLGLFEAWEGSVQEVEPTPGDLLALYTDGVTEAGRASLEGQILISDGETEERVNHHPPPTPGCRCMRP
ncbi:MAG: serine/threonine-protein phosphatase [Acidobacteriia bacterium]|nr:serine/threonine-protein phosphatase [Terriglobia bacterium]